MLRRVTLARQVRTRFALIALGEGRRPDASQMRVLRARGLVTADGAASEAGRAAAAEAVRNDRLWHRFLAEEPEDALVHEGFGLTPIDAALPRDLVARLERAEGLAFVTAAEFLQFDLPALLVGTLAALVCGLLGNFLVLRRQSLLGDAISHVVLPGIVAGFLVAGAIATVPMLLGAGAAALIAVALIELIRRLARVEPGAAMGVVFTTMFAAGVVLLEQSGARSVHLDVEHALYGNVEATIWLDVAAPSDLFDRSVLATLPDAIVRLGVVFAAALALCSFCSRSCGSPPSIRCSRPISDSSRGW